MSYITINGGRALRGTVDIQGSKNAVLPILAAALMVNIGKTRITGCPDITDVHSMLDLLVELGCKVVFYNHTIEVDASNASCKELTQEHVSNTRGSVLFAGALLGRFHKAVLAYPGGCAIGERKINYHVSVMKQLGAVHNPESGTLILAADKLTGTACAFPKQSVGATENAILCAVLADGRTTLKNAAEEPEITALIHFLNAAGARIQKINSKTIVIEGVKHLTGTEFKLPPDRIAAGTYMTAVAASGGKACIHNIIASDHFGFIHALEQTGCRIRFEKNTCEITAPVIPSAISLVTKPYPGFPTDMQSQMMAFLTMADGRSTITEDIFEDRFHTAEELNKMGADIRIAGGSKTAEIYGMTKLHGIHVHAKDLRGGAALCIAGLIAEGRTDIHGIAYIQRGYEDICHDLKMLGADIALAEDKSNQEIEFIPYHSMMLSAGAPAGI